MKLDILIDNPNSWFWDYIDFLVYILKKYGEVRIFKNHNEIKNGDILFILSCDKILKKDILKKHKNNIVIHESDLPKGKGWSPVSYQVEEGKNKIPITLFEADEKVDSGSWYIKDFINLDGSELVDEIRKKQAFKTIEMIEKYLLNYPMKPKIQNGKESFYPKRTQKNQEININNSIKEEFNKLRVCDNERYPAHFYLNGNKYIIKIYKS